MTELEEYIADLGQLVIQKPMVSVRLQQPMIIAAAMSDFVYNVLFHSHQFLAELEAAPPQITEWHQYRQELDKEFAVISEQTQLMQTVRRFRRHKLARIAWMQFNQMATTEQTLQQLSYLAEEIIIATRDWLYASLCKDHGKPTHADTKPQQLFILALGKLGGYELNFSSDVDLIFIYPEEGRTQGARRQLENVQFFTRLGQRLIKVLSEITDEGFVYRVDMRLRPFGDSGPLVVSFAALEDYYQTQGRDWERYALVKARLLGENERCKQHALQQLLRPFIYRRYIDFSVIQTLRDMRSMIVKEVRRRGWHDNIKLGVGGIREIEFIVQAIQLIRGGRDPYLQQQSLLRALQQITSLNLLAANEVNVLRHHYLFLRRVENCLQAFNDQQTHDLPNNTLDKQRLFKAMGYHYWQEFWQDLQQYRTEVRAIFIRFIGDDSAERESDINNFNLLWSDSLQPADLSILFPEFADFTRLYKKWIRYRTEINRKIIGQRGEHAIQLLIPRLLQELTQWPNSLGIFTRVMPLLLNIVSRTTYLELLIENHSALKEFVFLCATSPRIATQLTRYPILLDELLDTRTLYQPPTLLTYQAELAEYLQRIPIEDDELHTDMLRQFKQIQQLRIAAADIKGNLTITQVSEHLTILAETLIEAVIQRAWIEITAKYGQPNTASAHNKGIAIIAYGKLGGQELSYDSDLDLVFLIDSQAELGGITDGKRSLNTYQFYLRLTHRIIHLFTVRTSSGILYEVDTRLRPSGQAGLLVTSFTAFVHYQLDSAWLWEHQALVRARLIYGNLIQQRQFTQIRQQVLCKIREPKALQQQIIMMREKMHQQASQGVIEQHFDPKTSYGGIVDIEFIAQYLVLRFAAIHPQLTYWTDNLHLFALLRQTGILTPSDAQKLIDANLTLRHFVHQRMLQEKMINAREEQHLQLVRQQVQAIWQDYLHLLV